MTELTDEDRTSLRHAALLLRAAKTKRGYGGSDEAFREDCKLAAFRLDGLAQRKEQGGRVKKPLFFDGPGAAGP